VSQSALKTERHLAGAAANGAGILTGCTREAGQPTDLGSSPTVDVVTRDMLLKERDTSGPVAPVISFDSQEEAVW
jgi:succinate-semialdehyde dehydrogenase/glutarate-semialdehyde dehydrogenase